MAGGRKPKRQKSETSNSDVSPTRSKKQRGDLPTAASEALTKAMFWVMPLEGGVPFKVTPVTNDIDSLKKAIKVKLGTDYTRNPALITIHVPDGKGSFKEVTQPDAKLKANGAKSPYRYTLPRVGTLYDDGQLPDFIDEAKKQTVDVVAVTKAARKFTFGKSAEVRIASDVVGLERVVSQHGFHLHETSADGFCLYHAIAYAIIGTSPNTPYGRQIAEAVRNMVFNELATNRTVGRLVAAGLPGTMNASTYAATYRNNESHWGGNVELVAAAHALRANIYVLLDGGVVHQFPSPGATTNIYIAYNGVNHYYGLAKGTLDEVFYNPPSAVAAVECCSTCGKSDVTEPTKIFVRERDKVCQICGSKAVDVAHVFPKSVKGRRKKAYPTHCPIKDRHTPTNLVLLCKNCHDFFDRGEKSFDVDAEKVTDWTGLKPTSSRKKKMPKGVSVQCLRQHHKWCEKVYNGRCSGGGDLPNTEQVNWLQAIEEWRSSVTAPDSSGRS